MIQVFFDAALVSKPNMTPHQIHLYVLGLMADELAWAFNNDFSVAQNVRDLLEKLNPSDISEDKSIFVSAEPISNKSSGESEKNKVLSEQISKTKIGTNLTNSLSFLVLQNFLNKYPKVLIKDLRGEKNGFLWIYGTRFYLDDEKLEKWLKTNKFLWSEAESAWYFPFI